MHGTFLYTHGFSCFAIGTPVNAHITLHNLPIAYTVWFQYAIRTGHDTHVAACALLLVISHITCLRILLHGTCHAGVNTFGVVAMPAKNRRWLCLTINYHPVSCISAFGFMAYYTGCHTGKASYTAAAVNSDSIHNLSPPRSIRICLDRHPQSFQIDRLHPYNSALWSIYHSWTVSACCTRYNESVHTTDCKEHSVSVSP